MYSTTPAFNLKVVLKETGLAADTLRAWERRYGLPAPNRTAGGHRLYSQRDIETIKWLIKRQAEGLSISRAVDLWNEQIGSGMDPLAGSTQQVSMSPLAAPVQYRAPDTTLDTLREQWIAACMDFSESAAEQTLNQAFSMFPVEAVCLEVLQHGMSEIGERWYGNRATVQQEHFASALAMRRLDALLSASPAPTRAQTILVGCPVNEWHTFTPLLLALLLRRRGLGVIYLGANVPLEEFSNTVKELKVDLVVLVAQQLMTAASLQDTALILSSKNIPVAFGGRIFSIHPELPGCISGFFLGYQLPAALEEIQLILNRKMSSPVARVASPSYEAAYQAFISRRGQIELTLKQLLEPLAISPENIKTGTYFLGDNITAALQLGDMSLVSAEVAWLRVLLQAHETPPQQLIYFMEMYMEAVRKNIHGQGQPISDWLATEVEKLKVQTKE
ncbi:MAG TPA: B12-binding domain-containing protein [Anaerolineales bacterium]|nr:B12-binding domain-containing protein [Anaerolineales bacterium]